MTPIDRFERHLPSALTELAAPNTPDYLPDILGRTVATRQRAAWASIERWLPVQLTTSRVPGSRMPWRQLGVVALLTLLLAAALVAYVGSQQTRPLPAPFGPAANGSLLFARDGDIFTADPETGETTAIVTGPEAEIGPVFSLDGTRVVFARKPLDSSTIGLLFVGREDGGGLVQITPKTLSDLSDWSFSPDGRSIVAFAAGDQGRSIVVISSDGAGEPRFFPVFATRDDGPPQYRPDGSEIMFIGQEPDQAYRGVYGLNPATGAVRSIVPPYATLDIHGARWSPDGAHLAYGTWDPSVDGISARTRVVKADGTGDVAIETDPDSIADGGFEWSNDGTRLIVTRFYTDDGRIPHRSVILPIDRSSPGIEIACPAGAPATDCSAWWSWSPDDSVLVGSVEWPGAGGSQFLADPATGQVRAAPWTANEHPAWQRIAP
jgi:dipeptidyl aminopeptidase/acylaminoacyl peptidase